MLLQQTHPKRFVQNSNRKITSCRLLNTCAVLILMCVGLFITNCVTKHDPNSTETKVDGCSTYECLKTATDLLTALSPDVDPCDDFYGYACGGWIKSNDLSLIKTFTLEGSRDRFTEVKEESDKFLHHIMSSKSTRDQYAKSQAVNKAITYFDACLDRDAIDARGRQQLAALLHRHHIDSLVSKSWQSDQFDVTDVLVSLGKDLAINAFVTATVEADLRNSSQYVITLQQHALYGISMLSEVYRDKMRNMSILLGAELSIQLEQDLEEIIEIEKKNSKLVKTYYQFDKDALYKKITVRELEKITRSSKIDWVRYLRQMFAESGVNITPSYEIVVYDIDYITNISKLTSSLSKRSFSNYFAWRVIDYSSLFLGADFDQIWFQYYTQTTGSYYKQSSRDLCFFKLKHQFGMALGRLFVDHKFSGDSKKLVEEIVENLISSLIHNMRQITWMEEESKLAAIDKAKNILQIIGFPNFILDDSKLDKYYEDVVVHKDTYLENLFSASSSDVKRIIRKLGTVPDKSEWDTSPIELNAQYNPTANQIVFPAMILQPPFYNKAYLRASSYGAIGTIIGHEIMHGFDDKGSEYNKDGNLLQWWTENTTRVFHEKAECLIEQYNNFTFYGHRVSGYRALSENIADNAGVQYAFKTYEEWTKKNGEELPLPGTMLTNRQLFFVSFAQNWCKSLKPEARIYELFGAYAPTSFRVNATLQNIPEFSAAFGCPLGSPMNPVRKCKIW